jgi:hypothetical protein
MRSLCCACCAVHAATLPPPPTARRAGQARLRLSPNPSTPPFTLLRILSFFLSRTHTSTWKRCRTAPRLYRCRTAPASPGASCATFSTARPTGRWTAPSSRTATPPPLGKRQADVCVCGGGGGGGASGLLPHLKFKKGAAVLLVGLFPSLCTASCPSVPFLPPPKHHSLLAAFSHPNTRPTPPARLPAA